MSVMSPEEQYAQFAETKAFLDAQLRDHKSLQTPKVLIICGSGLGGLSDLLREDAECSKVLIDYKDIPGFKPSHVPGHSGKLVFGLLGANLTPVMCMVGRFHYYEGHSFFSNTLPVRIAKLMGAEYMIVTNAAGGIHKDYVPGDLMVIDDHINLPGIAGQHPLRGLNLDSFGPRFLPQSDAYDFDLRLKFFKAAETLKIKRNIHEGCYFYACGPTFETRAECRMISAMGGDAVGMSTVPEVTVARHSGLKVLGVSLITNAALATRPESAKLAALKGNTSADVVDQTKGMASHDEVLENANAAADDLKAIVELFVSTL